MLHLKGDPPASLPPALPPPLLHPTLQSLPPGLDKRTTAPPLPLYPGLVSKQVPVIGFVQQEPRRFLCRVLMLSTSGSDRVPHILLGERSIRCTSNT